MLVSLMECKPHIQRETLLFIYIYTDVDECVCPTLSSACSFNDTCVNTEGSYLCIGQQLS